MPRIDQLRIENFRGASTKLELTFSAKKKLVVIFGENGTGKTTIVDALDAIANCSGGSLALKSSTDVRAHWATVGKASSEIAVECTSGNVTWKSYLRKREIVTEPAPGPNIRVLRRSNLQKFIESQPARRYEELRHLIGVERVEKSEEALKRAVEETKTDLESAVRQYGESESQLRELWLEQGSQFEGALNWARTVASQDPKAFDLRANAIRKTRDEVDQADRRVRELRDAETELTQRIEAAANVENAVHEVPGIGAEAAMSIVGILTDVNKYLATGDQPDVCPVCRQFIPIDKLILDIESRMSDLNLYRTLLQQRKAAERLVQQAGDLVESRRHALLRSLRRLTNISTGEETGYYSIAVQPSGLATLNDEDPDWNEIADPAREFIAGCLEMTGQLENLERDAIATSERVSLISRLMEEVESSISAAQNHEKTLKDLKQAHEIVRLSRIQFTQSILDEVAAECNRLYSTLHPNERLAISRIALDQKQRASLNQLASFEGYDDVPPQAYFSEAHLDTLGFCFWLAFALRDSQPDDTVLVLDDVFSSVDSSHLRRIAQLFVDESSKFAQVIITTHHREWRDIYRNPYGPGNLTDLHELQSWDLLTGISSHRTLLSVEELEESLLKRPFDRQSVASKAGILLEATLDALAIQYRCKLPRTLNGAYTLGELLSNTKKLFDKLILIRPLADQALKIGIPAICHSRVREYFNVRNQVGAHHNLSGSTVSDSDIKDFGEVTLDLVRSVTCCTCGQIPAKNCGTGYKCGCPSAQAAEMQPLQLV